MNRYLENKITAKRYDTSVLPIFMERSTDYYIFSREGDRLDNLSQSFYNDPRKWWILAQANNLGKGSLIVPPGLQIRIPYPIDTLNIMLEQVIQNR